MAYKISCVFLSKIFISSMTYASCTSGYRARQSSASSDDNGQQDDNDDLLTLDQFLSECNRSPTSRVIKLHSTNYIVGCISVKYPRTYSNCRSHSSDTFARKLCVNLYCKLSRIEIAIMSVTSLLSNQHIAFSDILHSLQ